MALVAGPRNRQKYAPQVEGPVQPQPTNVIEAYQQGGIPAALGMIFNAPDPGIGPMSIVSKPAASTALRVLARPKVIEGGFTQGFGKLGKTVETGLSRVKKAVTGKPITVLGFRQAGEHGTVPGRGTFFSATPKYAQSVDPKAPSVFQRAGLKFKNPLVHRDQEGLLSYIAGHAGTDKEQNIARALQRRLVAADFGERDALHIDRLIARFAKRKGHDGIVYRDMQELVDLAIPKRGGQR